jgi:hypothetical protein
MKKFIRNGLSLLSLAYCLACNTPHSNTLTNKVIPSGTVILKLANGTNGNIVLIVDSIKIPVECNNSNKKYTSIEISGLDKGKHNFIILNSNELFGPDQFEIELGSTHGEYKVILSKRAKFNLNETLKLIPSLNTYSRTRARLLN